MPFIRRIRVQSFRQVPDFELELPDAHPIKPAHLILTCPIVSGTTSRVAQLGVALDGVEQTGKRPVQVSFTGSGLADAARQGHHVSLYRPAVFTPTMSSVSGPTAEPKGVFKTSA